MEKIVKTLISFKTISSDQKENERALRWIKKEITPCLSARIIKSAGYPSLIATTRKTKKPRVWLAAHNDVVPGSKNVFLPRVVAGKLYGRGAFDMKFAAACYIRLVKELGHEAKKHDFGIMITSDEEIGGKNGTGYILKQGYGGNIAFLPDGCAPESIEEAAKGAWHLEVEAKGASAHGSRPWAGKNAIKILLHFLRDLESIIPDESCVCDGSHYHDTLNIGKITGGEATNKVADSAAAHIDIRHVPETSKNDLWEKIKILAKAREIKIKEVVYAAPAKTDFAHKDVALFEKIYRNMEGRPLKRTVSHGSSDAHYFHKKGIPVILAQPKGGGHHAENEWVDLKNLERYYKVMKTWFLAISTRN